MFSLWISLLTYVHSSIKYMIYTTGPTTYSSSCINHTHTHKHTHKHTHTHTRAQTRARAVAPSHTRTPQPTAPPRSLKKVFMKKHLNVFFPAVRIIRLPGTVLRWHTWVIYIYNIYIYIYICIYIYILYIYNISILYNICIYIYIYIIL